MLLLLLASAALAKSWCADPLVAHEWGVTVLTADASPPERPTLPAYFHRPGDPFAVVASAVRTLPPDSGVRTLPVVHFYAPGDAPVPLAVEVGFTHGEASVWYPAVDRRIPAAEANGPEARAQREWLLEQRAALQPRGEREDLGPDPTRQLHWTALELTSAPTARPVATGEGWIGTARSIPHARWVGQDREAERFLFYEADTVERPAVQVELGADVWTVRNTSDHVVHDVRIVHRGRSASVPAVPPGGAIAATPHRFDPAETKRELTDRWQTDDAPPLERSGDREDCVMMRDPMRPVEQATGWRLYPDELALFWEAWEERLLGAQSHVVYRESTEALDTVMPVSLYTDMRHYVELSRLGVVLVDGLEAP